MWEIVLAVIGSEALSALISGNLRCGRGYGSIHAEPAVVAEIRSD